MYMHPHVCMRVCGLFLLSKNCPRMNPSFWDFFVIFIQMFNQTNHLNDPTPNHSKFAKQPKRKIDSHVKVLNN